MPITQPASTPASAAGGGGGWRHERTPLPPPPGLARHCVPGVGAHSASVRHTRRWLPGQASVSLAAAQVGVFTPPPTQQTWPASQLVGVQGGAVQTRAPPAAPPPPPPNNGEQVLPAGH